MSVALTILLAPLLAAGVVSAAAAVRDRDLRHAALFVLIGLLGARHALDPPAPDAFEQAFELVSAPVMLDLALNLAAWWLAIAVVRSLHERNRAEQVQWRDMETLRELAATLRCVASGTPAAANEVLAHGCRRFQLETGLLLRIATIEGTQPTAQILPSSRPQSPVWVGGGQSLPPNNPARSKKYSRVSNVVVAAAT